MELSIKNLQDSGSFTGAPVEKEIKWMQDGKELSATAYVRKLSYRSAISDAKQYSNGDFHAGRIASCICDKDGNPVFNVEDITGNAVINKDDSSEEKARKKAVIDRGPLDHELTNALLMAIFEVNGQLKKKRTK